MINIFWDSSALVKLYHLEKGSEQATTIFINPDYIQCASVLSKVEIRHALGRHSRDKKLTREELEHALLRLHWDSNRRIHFTHLNDNIINQAGKLALEYSIKSLDAIILASLNEFGQVEQETIFMSSDDQQIRLAKHLGFETINPNDGFL